MHKQICSFLMLLALSGSALKAYGEEPGFFEKRLYNPAWIYRYKTSQGRMMAIDVRQLETLLGLPIAGIDQNTSKDDPRLVYALIMTPIVICAGFWKLYQDWRGCFGDAFVMGPLMMGLNSLNIDPHVQASLIYGARALYTEKILPWSYEGEDAEENETLEFAE